MFNLVTFKFILSVRCRHGNELMIQASHHINGWQQLLNHIVLIEVSLNAMVLKFWDDAIHLWRNIWNRHRKRIKGWILCAASL